MKHVRAAVFAGTAGQIAVEELPLPATRAGEILVHVLGCTLCGSDLHSFHGRRSVPVPTILGHEIVGEIVEIDAEAPERDLAGRELRVGDRVTWAIVAHCGRCFYCQRGLPQKCLQAVKYGHEAIQPGRELVGGLAEYCLLAPGTSLVQLPNELPLSVVCPASCATATVAAALSAAGALTGQSVCLFGAGMLGLTAAAMAQTRGAAIVVAVDPLATRRELAARFGASYAVAPEELASMVRDVCGPHGFDVALELSGSPASFQSAWPLLRIGGTLVLVGAVFPTPPVDVPLDQLVRRQLTIRGVHNYAPQHLREAVDFLATHHERYPFSELVTDWFPLESVDQAFRHATDSHAVRVGVRPGNE